VLEGVGLVGKVCKNTIRWSGPTETTKINFKGEEELKEDERMREEVILELERVKD